MPMNSITPAKTPWHLWVVGGLAAFWNAFGCYIYVMTMLRDPAMMASALPEMVAALDIAPAWSHAAWAFGVWGGLGGSLLLLLKRRLAVTMLAISIAGLLATAIYEVVWNVPMDLPLAASIWAIALFLLWYASRMGGAGVLR